MELGKWFREENYGLPSFISNRSLQRNSTEDFDGWAFNKARHYPDIWIDPEDSIVLTIKGAEIVVSVSLFDFMYSFFLFFTTQLIICAGQLVMSTGRILCWAYGTISTDYESPH